MKLKVAASYGKQLHGGGEPPDNGDMEARIATVEQLTQKMGDRLTAVERDIAVIRSNYATTKDVSDTKTAIAEAKSSIIMWVVAAIFLAQLLPPLVAYLRTL